MMLLPGIDMLDHKRAQKILWSFEADNSGARIYCQQPILEGEIAFNNYGPKSNEELLMGYGFCFEPNPEDHVVLKLNLDGAGLGTHKMHILENCLPDVNGAKQFFLHHGTIDQQLLKALRLCALNDVETASVCQAITRGQSIDFSYPITLRSELVMIGLLRDKLHLKKSDIQTYRLTEYVKKVLETNYSELPRFITNYVAMYREGLFNNILSLCRLTFFP
jgi:hypothetical protein